MEGPRAAKREEVQSVIDLINLVFRTSGNLAPTMGEEFPLLLCEDNSDNMRIITEDNRPVSNVNYYPAGIAVENAVIRAASVGAVCTHPDYRGRNYATKILDDVEAKMIKEGVEVMLVSGGRSLYTRRGLVRTGGFKRAVLRPEHSRAAGIQALTAVKPVLEEINADNIGKAVKIYGQESVRYLRTYDEFVLFHKGATTPWADMFFKSYLITLGGRPVSYIIVRLFANDSRAEVLEYAGDRNTVIMGINRLIQMHGLRECSVMIPHADPADVLLQADGAEMSPADQQGTVKILNFSSFMHKLRPYFSQYLPAEVLQALTFTEHNGAFFITAGDESVRLSNMNMLCELVFGQREQEKLIDGLMESELGDKPFLKSVLNTVFPIPFPWTANMNYI